MQELDRCEREHADRKSTKLFTFLCKPGNSGVSQEAMGIAMSATKPADHSVPCVNDWRACSAAHKAR